MPPVERFVCRFAAEPPQAGLPDGDWATTLQAEFLAACLRIDDEGQDLGEAGDLRWFPDRTWNGRTFVPVTATTTTGLELFGFVSFLPGDPEPSDFESSADFTSETAERNPDWRIDLCEEVVGRWRGEGGRSAEELRRDMERDRFFTPEEAVDYGLIDRVHVDRNGGDGAAYSSSSSSSSS